MPPAYVKAYVRCHKNDVADAEAIYRSGRVATDKHPGAIEICIKRESWAELGPVLLRLEVRGEDTQLLLNSEALFGGDHPDLALEDLQSRLAPGERVVWEPGQTGILRLAMPAGCSSAAGALGAPPATSSTLDPQLILALKWAH